MFQHLKDNTSAPNLWAAISNELLCSCRIFKNKVTTILPFFKISFAQILKTFNLQICLKFLLLEKSEVLIKCCIFSFNNWFWILAKAVEKIKLFIIQNFILRLFMKLWIFYIHNYTIFTVCSIKPLEPITFETVNKEISFGKMISNQF